MERPLAHGVRMQLGGVAEALLMLFDVRLLRSATRRFTCEAPINMAIIPPFLHCHWPTF